MEKIFNLLCCIICIAALAGCEKVYVGKDTDGSSLMLHVAMSKGQRPVISGTVRDPQGHVAAGSGLTELFNDQTFPECNYIDTNNWTCPGLFGSHAMMANGDFTINVMSGPATTLKTTYRFMGM